MSRRIVSLLVVAILATAALPGRLPPGPASPPERAADAGVVYAQAGLPPLPSGWPSTLQLGRADSPGGAAAMRAQAPFGFRYQYLAGGVNTGSGWATWNPNGQFVTSYIQDSQAAGITPVFTYYMLYQSRPGGSSEQNAVLANLQTTATMQAYWADLRLFFQRAGAFPATPVVLHVEPDLWGYVQQRASGDDAATVPAQVSATGLGELAGLPNTVAGVAQAVVRLRDQYAPNVRLGYHVSIWGTGVDISLSDPSDAQVDALASRAGRFYRSLGARFDLSVGEFSDRDAAFKQAIYGQGPEAWWTAEDFRRHVRFMGRYVAESGTRLVLWQIPLGNTKMRAVNNTWNHYQDNRVEWLLDDPSRAHLTEYLNAGVIGFLFGRGADGATDARDANGDGVTNPAPINGNDRLSLSADDDGGFFHDRAKAYYQAGPLSLPGGSAPPPTPTQTAPPTATATATPTATVAPPTATVPPPTPTSPAATATPAARSFTTSAVVAPSSVAVGGTTTITASVTSATALSALVDVEVYSPSGAKVHQQFFDAQSFAAGQRRDYPVSWTVPAGAVTGTYTVKIGVFSVGWGELYDWNNGAATLAVTAVAPATPTPTPAADTTPPEISGLQVTGITRRAAIVQWLTNEPATHRVEYGTTPALGLVKAPTGRSTSHSVTLSGLTRGTTYYYRVVSRDAAGNTATSDVRSFTTNP